MDHFICFLFFLLVPLIDFPYAVLEKVVELFYYGEIRVLNSLKVKVYKALQFLEVDVPMEVPRAKPSQLKMPNLSMIDGKINLDPKNGMNSVRALFFSRRIYTNEFFMTFFLFIVKDANEKSLPPGQEPQQQQQQQKKQQRKQQPPKHTSNAV